MTGAELPGGDVIATDKITEPLDYAPPAHRRRRRRMWIRAFGLTFFVVVAVVLFHNRRTILAYARLHYYEHACRTFVAPPAHVALEFDPAKAARLVGQAGGDHVGGYTYAQSRAPAVFRPRALMSYLGAAAKFYGAIAYLGERRSSTGTRWLVIVEVGDVGTLSGDPAIKGGNCSESWINAYSLPVLGWRDVTAPPALTAKSGAGIILSRDFDRSTGKDNVVTINMPTGFYSGHSDPSDPSKFTIEYWTGGQQDFIDGQLLNNGRVTLTPRRAIVADRTWDNLPRDATRGNGDIQNIDDRR